MLLCPTPASHLAHGGRRLASVRKSTTSSMASACRCFCSVVSSPPCSGTAWSGGPDPSRQTHPVALGWGMFTISPSPGSPSSSPRVAEEDGPKPSDSLWAAAAFGDLEEIDRFLAEKPDVNARPVHAANRGWDGRATPDNLKRSPNFCLERPQPAATATKGKTPRCTAPFLAAVNGQRC